MTKHKANLRITPLSVIGESLITAGVVMLLFVLWQMFLNDPVVSTKQQTTAQEYYTAEKVEEKPVFRTMTDKMPQGKVFGRIYVPRFDKDYVRLLAQGTLQRITLNDIGVGHYLKSEWAGEVGNFALAAHRNSHGAAFDKIDKLTNGDRVYIETKNKWFTYEYRQTVIVAPTEIGVIAPVPKGMNGAHEGGKYLTLTSCHPKWSANQQRIIVWLELVEESNATDGVPQDLKLAQQ